MWLDTYIEYASEITDAPTIFHKYTGLSIAASALEDKVYFKFGDQLMRPNMWICLVAGSSVARKSTSLHIGRGIYKAATNKTTYPDEFSQESLVERFAAQPCGTMVASEFINLVSCIKRGYNEGCMGFLADLYDCPTDYYKSLKSGDHYINSPAINILAATTVEWFLDRLTPDDWAGGFVPRFLLIPFLSGSTRFLALPPPVDEAKRNKVSNGLRAMRNSRGEMYFSEETREIYKRWYARHSSRDGLPPRFVGSYHRMASMSIKLAMVFECMKRQATTKTEITVESLREATDCIDEASEMMCALVSDNFAFSKYEKERSILLGVIKMTEDGTIDHSDFLKKSKMSGMEFNRVIDTMVESDELSVEYIHSSTKRKKRYRINDGR